MRWPWSRTVHDLPSPPWRREWDTLSRYNAERARGILHTQEWQDRMAELQREFDEAHGRSPGRRDGLPIEI